MKKLELTFNVAAHNVVENVRKKKKDSNLLQTEEEIDSQINYLKDQNNFLLEIINRISKTHNYNKESDAALSQLFQSYGEKIQSGQSDDDLSQLLFNLSDFTNKMGDLKLSLNKVLENISSLDALSSDLKQVKLLQKRVNKLSTNCTNTLDKVKQANAKGHIHLGKLEDAEQEHNTALSEFMTAKAYTLKFLLIINEKAKKLIKSRLLVYLENLFDFFKNGYDLLNFMWPNLQQQRRRSDEDIKQFDTLSQKEHEDIPFVETKDEEGELDTEVSSSYSSSLFSTTLESNSSLFTNGSSLSTSGALNDSGGSTSPSSSPPSSSLSTTGLMSPNSYVPPTPLNSSPFPSSLPSPSVMTSDNPRYSREIEQTESSPSPSPTSSSSSATSSTTTTSSSNLSLLAPASIASQTQSATPEEVEEQLEQLLSDSSTKIFSVRKVYKNLSKRKKMLVINSNRGWLFLWDTLKKRLKSLPIINISKSLRYNKRLRLTSKSATTKTFSFESIIFRERFCEAAYAVLQGPQISSSESLVGGPAKVFIGTWNVGETPPPSNLEGWIPKEGYDIYAIGVQECEYIPRQGYNTPEADWFALLKDHLGETYLKIAGLSLNLIRLVVFIRRDLYPFVTHIKKGTEATGIAHVIGNKGAVGISFSFYETRLCFVTSHLAAHQDKIAERNSNYFEIIKGLKLCQQPLDITTSFHYLFWFGDLNYRIDLNRGIVLELIEKQDWATLYHNDQLNKEKIARSVFVDFQEGPIKFRPTYRFIRNSRSYNDEKQRIPSWCDRILWKSIYGSLDQRLVQTSYGSTESLLTSDHMAVYSTFEVPVFYHSTSHLPVKSSLRLTGINLMLDKKLEDSKKLQNELVLHFFSPYCLAKSVACPATVKKKQKEKREQLVFNWDSLQLPVLELVTSNHEFLRLQHLFINIRDHRDQDIGTATISLEPPIANQTWKEGTKSFVFMAELVLRGKTLGRIKGGILLENTEEETLDSLFEPLSLSFSLSPFFSSSSQSGSGGTGGVAATWRDSLGPGIITPFVGSGPNASNSSRANKKGKTTSKKVKASSFSRASWSSTDRKSIPPDLYTPQPVPREDKEKDKDNNRSILISSHSSSPGSSYPGYSVSPSSSPSPSPSPPPLMLSSRATTFSSTPEEKSSHRMLEKSALKDPSSSPPPYSQIGYSSSSSSDAEKDKDESQVQEKVRHFNSALPMSPRKSIASLTQSKKNRTSFLHPSSGRS